MLLWSLKFIYLIFFFYSNFPRITGTIKVPKEHTCKGGKKKGRPQKKMYLLFFIKILSLVLKKDFITINKSNYGSAPVQEIMKKRCKISSVAKLTLWHWTVPEYLVFQGNSTAQPVGVGSLIRPITKQLIGQLSIIEAWLPL